MGYGHARARGSRFEQLGFSGSGSTTSVTSGATAGTFGTLTTIGTTGFAYDGLILNFGSASARRGIVTLTANTGGADEVIADSVPFSAETTTTAGTINFDLPIRVPSGAVIKAKVATQTAGSSLCHVAVTGYRSAALARGFSQIVSCTDLTSSDPSNLITLTSTTLTGWVQIRASTPNPIGMLWVVPLSTSSLSIGATGQLYVEIGFGGSGSEAALFRSPVEVNATFLSTPMGIPLMLPAGTRLAARAQASGTATGTIGIACYGAVP